jgi:hypothetical protein
MEGFQGEGEFEEFGGCGGGGVVEGFDGFCGGVFEEEAGEREECCLWRDGGEGEVGPELGVVCQADEICVYSCEEGDEGAEREVRCDSKLDLPNC